MRTADEILAGLPPAEADVLRRAMAVPAWERRRARLDARDQAIRALAATYYAGMSSRATAEQLAADLVRHVGLAGRLIHSPHPERMALIHAIRLSEGSLPRAAQVRRILAGERTPVGGIPQPCA